MCWRAGGRDCGSASRSKEKLESKNVKAETGVQQQTKHQDGLEERAKGQGKLRQEQFQTGSNSRFIYSCKHLSLSTNMEAYFFPKMWFRHM